jgi:integrase/recombinase XerC
VARVDQPARAPRALGEDEARRLLRAARRTGSTRGRALLALLSGTGLRLAEAAALDVDDVPTTERTGAEHVRAGKGERPRTVPLPADARSLLRCWLTERAQHPAVLRGEPALWLGRRAARQLQRIVAELGADAWPVDVSAHTLRHTAATRWLRAGVDVVVVADLLGHASLDTPRTYTLPTDRELAAAVEAAAVEAGAVE